MFLDGVKTYEARTKLVQSSYKVFAVLKSLEGSCRLNETREAYSMSDSMQDSMQDNGLIKSKWPIR